MKTRKFTTYYTEGSNPQFIYLCPINAAGWMHSDHLCKYSMVDKKYVSDLPNLYDLTYNF